MDSQKHTDIIDQIRVKKFTTGDMNMIRLHSDNFGVVSGDNLSTALRNMADSIELYDRATRIQSASVRESTEEKSTKSQDRQRLSEL